MIGDNMIAGILYEGARFFTILVENKDAYIVAEWIMCDDATHPNKASLTTSVTEKIKKSDQRIERISDDIFELV